MSIEKNLDRIATALERIANAKEASIVSASSDAPEAPKQPAPAPVADTASTPVTPAPAAVAQPAPPAQPATPAPTPQSPVATPAAPVQEPVQQAALTPEALNQALVAEFNRLGSREGIDNAIKELGATSITDLPAEQYQSLLDKVKALA